MKNGCHNRTFNEEYIVQDGYKMVRLPGNPDVSKVRVQNFIYQPFRMSTECKYDFRQTDTGCVDCTHQTK
jgi:hypothetical protein